MKRLTVLSLATALLSLTSCQLLKASSSGVSGFTNTLTVGGQSLNYAGSLYSDQDIPVVLFLIPERQSGEVLVNSGVGSSGKHNHQASGTFTWNGQSLPWSCKAKAQSCTVGDRSFNLTQGQVLVLKPQPSNSLPDPQRPPSFIAQQVSVDLGSIVEGDRIADPNTLKQVIQGNPTVIQALKQ